MQEEDLTAGIMDLVRINGLLADGAVAAADVSTILEALGDGVAVPAVASMSMHACGAPLGPEESRLRLGLPASGPRCLVYERGEGEGGFAAVEFDCEAVRRLALETFMSQPGEPAAALRGCPVPEEAALRIGEIRRQPGLAGHLSRSAADHMAAHVAGLLCEIPGVAETGGGRFLWAAAFEGGKEAEALAWVSLPGPGPLASSIVAFLPREAQP